MSLFLKLFNTTAEYNAYTADTANFIKPNVSCTLDDLGTVHYNPWVETRVVAKYNVTDTSNPTPIGYKQYTSGFSEIEIDGVVQPSVVSAYTFNTTGEHTVKYTLTDPTSIGGSAFTECTSLTSIVIPSSVTSIGNWAFMYCSSLTRLNIPSGVTRIGSSTFAYCSSLTSITIPDTVTNIDVNAFSRCSSLTNIVIPDSVTNIGSFAFMSCTSLTSCTIGSGATSIGSDAFIGCSSLISVSINSNAAVEVFDGSNRSMIQTVVIGDSVTSIRNNAFNGCSSLTSIVCNAATAPTIQSSTFQNVKTGGTLTVPQGSSGYDVWMGTGDYYLGKYNWTKVEQ